MNITLSSLLAVLSEKQVVGPWNPAICGVAYDPLRVKPGFLYVAINIYTQLDKIEIPDGHAGVAAAIQAGAVAVVLQRDLPVPGGIVKILVPDSRRALALLAGAFYGHPGRSLRLIGVTGTSGKTTVTHVIESLLATQHRVGLIGTLYYKINGRVCLSKDTTPEPPDLEEILGQMAAERCGYCAMEVSSHGIDFHRVAGQEFETGVWTNLAQDHLDWHKTMENYRDVKARWLATLGPDKHAAINADDPHAPHFIEQTSARKVLYGLQSRAEVTARNCRFSADGTRFTLVTPRGEMEINARLRGRFNLYNMLAAVAAVIHLPLSPEDLKQGLESDIVVAGRLQPVECGQPFSVMVDYAHSPDGLEKVLAAVRVMQPRRVITVFGCGGDRDRTKRPRMGAVVEAHSDYFIVTEDNPRTEDSRQIMDDITAGLQRRAGGHYDIIFDRREAIRRALAAARPGDLVLIAGKGHESVQIFKDRAVRFNDHEVADGLLRELGWSRSLL